MMNVLPVCVFRLGDQFAGLTAAVSHSGKCVVFSQPHTASLSRSAIFFFLLPLATNLHLYISY